MSSAPIPTETPPTILSPRQSAEEKRHVYQKKDGDTERENDTPVPIQSEAGHDVPKKENDPSKEKQQEQKEDTPEEIREKKRKTTTKQDEFTESDREAGAQFSFWYMCFLCWLNIEIGRAHV